MDVREHWSCWSSDEMPVDSWLFLVLQCVHLIECVGDKLHTFHILYVHMCTKTHTAVFFKYAEPSVCKPECVPVGKRSSSLIHLNLSTITKTWREYREGFISEQLCWVETVAQATQDWLPSKNQLQFVSVWSVWFGKEDNSFGYNFSLALAETSKEVESYSPERNNMPCVLCPSLMGPHVDFCVAKPRLAKYYNLRLIWQACQQILHSTFRKSRTNFSVQCHLSGHRL